MNPEEYRAFRDDVDEENWVDTKQTIMQKVDDIEKLNNELRDMMNTRQVPIRKVFENEAEEDLEIEAMKEAEIKKY